MGFKLKLPKKISLPKLPKVKLGDPSKLITKPIEGIQNSIGSVTKNALDNVGSALKSDGAAPVLTAAGAAFGGPAGGLIASQLVQSLPKNESSSSGSSGNEVLYQPSQAYGAPGIDNKTLLFAGLGGITLIAIFAMMAKR